MKGFISLAALFALAGSGLADGWMLKSPLDAKKKTSWKVSITANVSGQDHQAAMTQVLSIDSKTEKGFKGNLSWTEVTMDGSDLPQTLPSWDVTFNPNGSISSGGEDADYARMMAPGTFIYPDKEVNVGDKWTVKFKPASDAKEMTVDYEVVKEVKVGDAAALEIRGKLSEDGPMKGDDTYWIGRDGTLLKFDLNLTNWIVPFAGEHSEVDAKIHGDWVKS
jgi:hypothetical protein